jgi:hypothetical protein
MAVFLLDTMVIVDTLNGKKARYEFLDALLPQRNLLACCSIKVTEVFAGVRPDEERSHAFAAQRYHRGGRYCTPPDFLTDNKKHFPMSELSMQPLP